MGSAIVSASEVRTGRRDRQLAAIIGAAGFLFLLPGVFWGLPFGKSAVGALQILEGHVPYRDFWTMYAPGMYYLTAFVFWIAGPELVFQGMAACAIDAAIAVMIFIVIRHLDLERLPALLASMVVILTRWHTAPEIHSYPPALLAGLLAIHQVVLYHRTGRPGRLFRAGIWFGLAACFKHDIAAYLVVATILSVWAASWDNAAGQKHGLAAALRATGRLLSGTMAFFLPMAVLIGVSAGAEAWRDLFYFPATDFPKLMGEGYFPLVPSLEPFRLWAGDPGNLVHGHDAVRYLQAWGLIHLPELAFAVALVALVRRWRQIAPWRRFCAVFFLAAMPLFWAAAHVQRNTHPYSMAILTLLLGSLAWSDVRLTSRKPQILFGAAASLYVLFLMMGPMIGVLRVAVDWPDSRILDIPGARWVRVPMRDYEVYRPISSFIRQNTGENERIYVGVEQHDAIVITDMRFHYLTGRLSCCRYSELHAGITDRIDAQREIARGMESAGVRAVVIWRFGWPQPVLDQIKQSRMAVVEGLGETWLNDYIEEHFEPLAEYGEYVLMWRRDAPPPVRSPGISWQE